MYCIEIFTFCFVKSVQWRVFYYGIEKYFKYINHEELPTIFVVPATSYTMQNLKVCTHVYFNRTYKKNSFVHIRILFPWLEILHFLDHEICGCLLNLVEASTVGVSSCRRYYGFIVQTCYINNTSLDESGMPRVGAGIYAISSI